MSQESFSEFAYRFEERAHHQYGDFNVPGDNIARVPVSFARGVVEYWKNQAMDLPEMTPDESGHVWRMYRQLEQLAKRPGRELAPWAAEEFWTRQEEFAELLDGIAWRATASNVRNAWFQVRTWGQVEAEMKTTDNVIQELAQAIYDRYRRAYLDAHDAAFAEFHKENGRYASVPTKSGGEMSEKQRKDTEEILARISAKTGQETTLENVEKKSYEPRFVEAWERFYQEWRKWYAENDSFWARGWGGTWTKTMEYREKALEWRRKFEARDPVNNKMESPEPTVPKEPWDDLEKVGDWLGTFLKWGAVAVVGVTVGPPLIKALWRKDDD